jgi:hypothetical protein
MKLLPKLPNDSDMVIAIDPMTATNSESMQRILAVRFGKRFDTAVGVLVSVVAASGWLYLITTAARAFVSWM